jgi:hypothetical protein
MPEAATLYCFLRSHFCQSLDKCTTNKTFNLPEKEKKRKENIQLLAEQIKKQKSNDCLSFDGR